MFLTVFHRTRRVARLSRVVPHSTNRKNDRNTSTQGQVRIIGFCVKGKKEK